MTEHDHDHDHESDELPLLNIYEVEAEEGGTRHLVGFLDPVRAGAVGIDSRAMVGEFQPDDDGEFDPDTFEVNPEFVEAVVHYLNHKPERSPALIEGAKEIQSDWLYLVDPRNETGPDEDPPAEDVLGAFAVDETGQIVPGSFQYNENHVWFDRELGVSGLLSDRKFYDWLQEMIGK